MTEELEQTIKLIIDCYGDRSTGSVFIPMSGFPWYNERNGQLTKLYDEGMITRPRYYDDGVEITLTNIGREYFNGILFPAPGTPMTCPICGMRAKIIQTDAARSWAEIGCENCSTYAIRKDALLGIAVTDFPLLSGYYRHAWHGPMTIQCDSQDTIEEHVMETRRKITRDYQIKMLLSHYYQQMNHFGEQINFEGYPAIAYATDMEDLNQIICEAVERNFVVVENGTITVTKQGKEWIDTKESGDTGKVRDEIFISHRTTDSTIADMIKDFLVNTGIPNNKIFCSSLPGNDVNEKISPEVKKRLKNSAINILILSKDYYDSAYCLNEAGIAWYLDDVPVIPIGLPEINHNNMIGFLNSDYKLRRLNNDDDISYLYDVASEKLDATSVKHGVITREIHKIKDRYMQWLSKRNTDVDNDEETTAQDSNTTKATLERDEGVLLVYAAADPSGMILHMNSVTRSGPSTSTCGYEFADDTARESARWKVALEKLERYDLVEATSYKRDTFKVTSQGYKVADQAKEKWGIDTSMNPDEYLVD